MEDCLQLLKKYNISYSERNDYGVAIGMGDILLELALLTHGIIQPPLVINIRYFFSDIWFPNPLNALEFRVQMIRDLLAHIPSLSPQTFQFILGPEIDTQTNSRLKTYSDLYEKLPSTRLRIQPHYFRNTSISGDYIVFHTKLRLAYCHGYDYIKSVLYHICKNFKATCQVVLLGEKTFPTTTEKKCHGITTIYPELLELKRHNAVLDLTVDSIYNTMNYENYKKDISIIKHAKYNICIGQGGHFVTSLLFGNVLSCVAISQCMISDGLMKRSGNKNFPDLHQLFDYIRVS